MTAREELGALLVDLEERGETWPCRGDEAWVSEDHRERDEAARRCAPCVVLEACDLAAVGEKWGVWAGRDRAPRPGLRAGAA